MLASVLLSLATLTVSQVPHAPAIEELAGRAPQEAGAITDFRQREPHDGDPASRATRAYLSYDKQNFYAVFVCHDDPKDVRARLTRRDEIEQDDQVVLLLDTFHDGRRAYLFASNPLGVQRDGIVTEGQEDDFMFDAVWSAEGRLTPDGYIVRMTIPFRSLRFPNGERQTWGIAVGRIIPRISEESYWPHITKRIGSFVDQMATLEGLREVSPGRNMQFAPYVAGSQARFLDGRAAIVRQATEQRVGLDAKAVLRDSITVDVTMHPDFSQVESNEPQVTANQRFEVFFPEKRPFFLENAGFLQTPVNLFFSRRIAEPQFGVRLSGKAGGTAFGVVAADDRAAGRKLPSSDARRNDSASTSVVRAQREIGRESTLGVFLSERRFGKAADRMLAVDTRLKLDAHWTLQAQAMWSDRRSPQDARRAAPGFFAELKRSGRTFDYTGRYTDFARDFGAPLGFVKRVDVRQIEQSAKVRWRPAGGLVTKFGPSLSILGNWDHQGVLQNWDAHGAFKVELTGRTEVEVLHRQSFERFAETDFRKNATELQMTSEWLQWLAGSASIARGTEINFDAPTGTSPFLARSTVATLALAVLPTAQLRLDTTMIFSGLKARGSSVFSNQVARLKVNYQLSPRLSVRTILDYDLVAPNPALSRLERASSITGDFLVTYLVSPGTAAYIGYTDRRENLLLDQAAVLVRSRSLSPTSRQVFAKVSYLWHY